MTKKYTALKDRLRGALRLMLLVLALILTGILAFGVWKAGKRKDTRSSPQAAPMDAAMQLTNMEYTEMDNGRKVWTLRSQQASYFDKEQKTLLKGVRLVLYLEDGQKIHLKSRNGLLYAGTKNIELWGSVQADVPEGYKITTERANYQHEAGLVSSKTPITVTGPEVELKGNSWQYDVNKQRGALKGSVDAVIHPDLIFKNAES